MNFNTVLIKFHRWVGFPVGVLFIVTLLTGILTGLEDYLTLIDDYDQKYVQLSNTEIAHSVSVLTSRPPSMRQLVIPKESVPYFKARLRGESYIYAIQDLSLIEHQISNRNGFWSFILRWHRNYNLGRTKNLGLSGAEWVAWVGLLAAFISLLGLYLWWPHKRTFKVKRLIPSDKKISSYYFSHLSSGVVTLIFILLFSLTGAAITYRSIAKQILLPNSKSNTIEIKNYLAPNWLSAITAAKLRFPDAELTSISPPSTRTSLPGEVYTFNFVTSGDWLGYPGSKVLIDPVNGYFWGAKAFIDKALGEKLYQMIKPLHTGLSLSPTYLFCMLILMTLSLIMTLSGVVSFVRKKSKYEKKANTLLKKMTILILNFTVNNHLFKKNNNKLHPSPTTKQPKTSTMSNQ